MKEKGSVCHCYSKKGAITSYLKFHFSSFTPGCFLDSQDRFSHLTNEFNYTFFAVIKGMAKRSMKSFYEVWGWYSLHAPQTPLPIYFTNNKMASIANQTWSTYNHLWYVSRLGLSQMCKSIQWWWWSWTIKKSHRWFQHVLQNPTWGKFGFVCFIGYGFWQEIMPTHASAEGLERTFLCP